MLLAMLEIQGIDSDTADDWPKNLPEDQLNTIYEELSFSLRHNVERTKASRASGMALVPAPMREEANGIVQPLECAWTNVETDAKSLVPAPMREEVFGIVQPLDSAGTYRKAARRVPAPRLELGTP